MVAKHGWLVTLGALLALGCSSEDDGADPAPCPDGAGFNDLFQCLCDEGASPNGLTQCQEDFTLTGCDCGSEAQTYAADVLAVTGQPPVPAPGGDTMPTGDGMAMAPGMVGDDAMMLPPESGGEMMPPEMMTGDGDAMAGDGDAMAGDGDAMAGDGDAMAGDGDAMAGDGDSMGGDGDEPPAGDGGQLSLCDTAVDCNAGLDCYNVHPNGGFCTATCQDDGDCSSLTGADYSCYVPDFGSGGLCRVNCTGEGDDGPCPTGLSCRELPASGLFRCVP